MLTPSHPFPLLKKLKEELLSGLSFSVCNCCLLRQVLLSKGSVMTFSFFSLSPCRSKQCRISVSGWTGFICTRRDKVEKTESGKAGYYDSREWEWSGKLWKEWSLYSLSHWKIPCGIGMVAGRDRYDFSRYKVGQEVLVVVNTLSIYCYSLEMM